MSGITYYKTTFADAARELGLINMPLPPGDDPLLTIVSVDYCTDTFTLRNGKTISRGEAIARHGKCVWYVVVLDDLAKEIGWEAPDSWKLVMREP